MNVSHYTGKDIHAAYSICKLRYTVPTEIPGTLRNGINYEYYLQMKELTEEI